MTSITCPKCNGEKTYVPSWDSARRLPCTTCCAVGHFEDLHSPEVHAAILSIIRSSQGKNKGKLRAQLRSVPAQHLTPIEKQRYHRAYYVWRMARYHGGVDMCMPVMAGLFTGDDPQLRDLEVYADEVAKKAFGTDLAAAYRWGKAMGAI